LNKNIIEVERKDLWNDCVEGIEEYKCGSLKSSDDDNELIKMMNEL
jgi:hypothetical protein